MYMWLFDNYLYVDSQSMVLYQASSYWYETMIQYCIETLSVSQDSTIVFCMQPSTKISAAKNFLI